jgi:hypothetical protein
VLERHSTGAAENEIPLIVSPRFIKIEGNKLIITEFSRKDAGRDEEAGSKPFI